MLNNIEMNNTVRIIYKALLMGHLRGDTFLNIIVDTNEVTFEAWRDTCVEEGSGFTCSGDYSIFDSWEVLLEGETPSITPTGSPPPTFLPGDVNGDDQVNLIDAQVTFTHWLGSFSSGLFEPDGNGKLNGLDFSYIVKNWSS